MVVKPASHSKSTKLLGLFSYTFAALMNPFVIKWDPYMTCREKVGLQESNKTAGESKSEIEAIASVLKSKKSGKS